MAPEAIHLPFVVLGAFPSFTTITLDEKTDLLMFAKGANMW